ncbi:hypothetical protein Tco_0156510 [Tanacetum coccineum]
MEKGEGEEDINFILNNFTFKMSKIMNIGGEENQVTASDFVLPLATIAEVKHRFANSLVGFFVGKTMAFTLVENYVKNTWTKFGFQKVIKNEDGFFFFKFATLKGLEQVIEQGPWLIRSSPLILNKWTPNLVLKKDEVTKIGKPIMLDAFTSSMCVDPWGRLGYALALIEVSAEKPLKHEVIMAFPEEDGLGHTLETIRVEYEWKPPLCIDCHVFRHSQEQCPMRVKEQISEAKAVDNDGFTKVTKKKKTKHVEKC